MAIKVKAFGTDEEALAIAREVAGDRATISLHQGDPGHVALRITGCFAEDAREVGCDIERRLFGEPDHRVGFVQQSGFAAVWIR